MSFAETCREELTKIRLHAKDERLSQLIGLTVTAGGIRLFGKPSVFYQTESVTVAKHIAALAVSDYMLESMIVEKRRENRSRPIYAVQLSGVDMTGFMTETGALTYGPEGVQMLSEVPAVAERNDETQRAFLRGCFLGGGTCVDPKRSYHLEIICRAEAVAHKIVSLIEAYRIRPRLTTRKDRYVVYLKGGDDVTGFLALIGANTAVLSLESVRAEKDMRNYINRTSNCETANLDKQVIASLKQRAAIRTVQKLGKWNDLPDSLREAAELRLNYPDATLEQLAELAGIRKSGMNHRLTRLLSFARELEENG